MDTDIVSTDVPYDLLLTAEGLIELYDIDDKINKNKYKYLEYINSDKQMRSLYKKTCLSLIKQNKIEQQKGGSAVISGIFAGVGILAGVAAAIYMWYHRKQCKLEYPLVNPEKIPTALDIILKICPKSWAAAARKYPPKQFLLSLRHKFDDMRSALSVLNTETFGKKLMVNTMHIVAGVGAAIATAGLGGDMLINMVFTIKSILDLIIGTIDGLIDILLDKDGIRFIYDIFSIDFRDGPFGVKCWMEYILKSYGEGSKAYAIACKFFNMLVDKFANFIGNMMGSMIPDTVGLLSLIVPMIINNFQKGAFTFLEKQLNKYYNRIPWDKRQLIEHPDLFKAYLDKKITTGQKLLLGFGKKMFNSLRKNTALFAISIHKFMAIMWSLIQIFITCGKTGGPAEQDDNNDDKEGANNDDKEGVNDDKDGVNDDNNDNEDDDKAIK
jgi:hypothetical protein